MSETAKHTLMGGKLHLYKRENSYYWQCSTFLGKKNRRTTTKETSLARAKDFAEDWYLELLGKHKRGEMKNEKTFGPPPINESISGVNPDKIWIIYRRHINGKEALYG